MLDNGDVKIPDAIKSLLRSECLRRIGSSSSLDQHEMKLFNWYFHESEKQLGGMISAEHEYIEAQVRIGEEEINDSGMVAVEYFLKRSRYSHVIYLVSLFESFLDNSCIKLSKIIGENNLPFNVTELKGDQWSVKKKYLERYGKFKIPPGLWSEIVVLIKVRNNIVHDNGRVNVLNREEISVLKKHKGISLGATEIIVEPMFIKSSINSTNELVDSVESNLSTLLKEQLSHNQCNSAWLIMDKTAAIAIIESLANGRDPFTGEQFPNESALQNANVVRALYFALSKIYAYQSDTILHYEIDDLVKSEQEKMWKEYREIVKYKDPYNYMDADGKEDFSDVEEIEEDYYEDDEPYDYYNKDYEDAMDDIRQEIYENMEDYARSEEAGWYYPNSEGSWEDNLSGN